jgi:hypothetical protein
MQNTHTQKKDLKATVPLSSNILMSLLPERMCCRVLHSKIAFLLSEQRQCVTLAGLT